MKIHYSGCGREVDESEAYECHNCGKQYCEDCAEMDLTIKTLGICSDCEEDVLLRMGLIGMGYMIGEE